MLHMDGISTETNKYTTESLGEPMEFYRTTTDLKARDSDKFRLELTEL